MRLGDKAGSQARVNGHLPGCRWQRSNLRLEPRHNEVGVSPCLLLHAPFDAFVLDEQDPRAPAKARGVRADDVSPCPWARIRTPSLPPCWPGSRDNDRVGRRTVIEVAVSQRPASTTPCESPIRIDSTLTLSKSFPLTSNVQFLRVYIVIYIYIYMFHDFYCRIVEN